MHVWALRVACNGALDTVGRWGRWAQKEGIDVEVNKYMQLARIVNGEPWQEIQELDAQTAAWAVVAFATAENRMQYLV